MIEEKPQFLSVGDRGIAYLDDASLRDDGLGLFWLSGFHSVMTSAKVTFLANYAREEGLGMTRFDYSGHGMSEGDIADGVISDWLDEAWEVFTRVSSGPHVVIGSSMGGWLALLLARRLMQGDTDVLKRIRGLVLLAPAWDMTERLMWDQMPETVKTHIVNEGVWDRPSAYGDGPYPITKALIEDGRTHLVAGAEMKVPFPVRILHGMQDPDVPWEGSVELMDMLAGPDKHLHLIQDAEHRLSRDCDLAELVRAIEAMVG